MNASVEHTEISRLLARKNGVLARFKRHWIFGLASIACLLGTLYWGLVASDRYVSEARVVIQRTDLGGGQMMDFSSLISGATGANHSDQMLLRDHLLSVDMLNRLDAKLGLRAHYSDAKNDFLSRMWFRDAPAERFYQYYLTRVSIDYDDYAGVLIIKAQAYDRKTAHAITAMLVEEGERTMNRLAHQLAQEQVSFVERQVTELARRFQDARYAVLAYQNKKGMVAPQATAENLVATISRLEGQRTDLQARRNAMLGYLSPKAPDIVELDFQLSAIDKQIAQEKARLTAPGGKTLNSTVEEYQRLEMAAGFAEDVYKTALVALEKGRVEATRTIKKVSILQSPTEPEYPLEPYRLYNIAVFIMVTLLLAGIMHLLAAIVRDHRD